MPSTQRCAIPTMRLPMPQACFGQRSGDAKEEQESRDAPQGENGLRVHAASASFYPALHAATSGDGRNRPDDRSRSGDGDRQVERHRLTMIRSSALGTDPQSSAKGQRRVHDNCLAVARHIVVVVSGTKIGNACLRQFDRTGRREGLFGSTRKRRKEQPRGILRPDASGVARLAHALRAAPPVSGCDVRRG